MIDVNVCPTRFVILSSKAAFGKWGVAPVLQAAKLQSAMLTVIETATAVSATSALAGIIMPAAEQRWRSQ